MKKKGSRNDQHANAKMHLSNNAKKNSKLWALKSAAALT